MLDALLSRRESRTYPAQSQLGRWFWRSPDDGKEESALLSLETLALILCESSKEMNTHASRNEIHSKYSRAE